MKKITNKIIWFPLFLLLSLVVYLYTANAFIYFRIGSGNFVFPLRESEYNMTSNNNKEIINYLALGDSLTSGLGADNYEQAYPYLIAKEMSSDGQNVNLKNLSFPGARSSDLITNFLEVAIRFQPDLITVLIGVNDIHNHVSKTDFEANYRLIVDRLSSETKANIYLISIPYIGSPTAIFPPLDYYFDEETNAYNEIIKKIAQEYDISYLDLNRATKKLFKTEGPHYSADSFHPSAYGYKLWADIIYEHLN